MPLREVKPLFLVATEITDFPWLSSVKQSCLAVLVCSLLSWLCIGCQNVLTLQLCSVQLTVLAVHQITAIIYPQPQKEETRTLLCIFRKILFQGNLQEAVDIVVAVAVDVVLDGVVLLLLMADVPLQIFDTFPIQNSSNYIRVRRC